MVQVGNSALTRAKTCLSAAWLKSQTVRATMSGCRRYICSTIIPMFSLMVADTTCHSTDVSSAIWACNAGSASEEWAYELLRSIQRSFIGGMFLYVQNRCKNKDGLMRR